jgi:osmoprotectant transport system permease protein
LKTLTLILLLGTTAVVAQQPVRVGAKHFTEGYILSEILAQLIESKGIPVKRTFNLGGTLVCFQALNNDEIDIYPEYTGTITREILKLKDDISLDELNKQLQQNYSLRISRPYGFNNSYSLIVTNNTATELGLHTISDLAKYPDLKTGISYEFLKREDGWDRLAEAYLLPQKPAGLEHGLAYQALLENKISLTDCYSTDGEISENKLVMLTDDRKFFPLYEAVSLYKTTLDSKAKDAIAQLSGMIDEHEMSDMNAKAIYGRKSFEEIAKGFLNRKGLIQTGNTHASSSFNWNDLASKTLQHLYLTFTALVLAIAFAVPLGIALYWNPRGANVILYIAGLLQTIPSIALLAIMIPVFGIGAVPAIVALFVYAILPILRNTVNGLRNIDPLLKEIAASLGMSRGQALRYVEFPLALPVILTGIRIAAVINVGTATLAAFIGAGGLGEYIVTGLALNNTSMILTGAIPAAVLALLIELIFEGVERKIIPAHLRKK